MDSLVTEIIIIIVMKVGLKKYKSIEAEILIPSKGGWGSRSDQRFCEVGLETNCTQDYVNP